MAVAALFAHYTLSQDTLVLFLEHFFYCFSIESGFYIFGFIGVKNNKRNYRELFSGIGNISNF